ncbi:hypothetical protein Tco_0925957, partial [Tanacetum coccineum]
SRVIFDTQGSIKYAQVQPSLTLNSHLDKAYPLEQVIGDPSKPVMTRSRLYTNAKVYMYALTVSTTEPKNIKEALSDNSWIESIHGMDECDSMSTQMAIARLDADLQRTPTNRTKYHSIIRGLIYLTASRQDIAFATFTYNMGIRYPKNSSFELITYSDADHVGFHDDCKSTSGGLQFLCEKLVSWSSKKQDCTAMSIAESELYRYLFAVVIWMRTKLLDYEYKFNKISMYCDSKSVIAISCNPVQHSRTNHINIWYYFIKEHIERGTVELYFVRTEYQLADLFTKALPKERFKYLVQSN